MQSSSLSTFHPSLAEWFEASFGEPTDVQKQAWKAITATENTLIAAPTGSGKTLAAVLPCLDGIARLKQQQRQIGVRLLYITPLKALNNDIHDHLVTFIEQIDKLAASSDNSWPGIRSGVRTGDTSSSVRSAMYRRPPDILVTTPESLYILLTSEKGREMLRTVSYAIIDEIHDLAADKRGSHLSLSLERLEEWCGRRIQRIGVSATQKPLERVARFLGGWQEATSDQTDELQKTGSEAFRHPLGYLPRKVTIVESHMSKQLEVSLTMPDQSHPMQTRDAIWLPILDRLFALMADCRSVIIFVNSRRLCERLCLRLNDHAGYEMARAHHGSIAKERRLEVERMLKAGELRCIVATSSLELGIDVGHIELVIQLDSPIEAASGIQRIGRAGHAVGSASRGAMVARQRGVLPEMAVLGRLIAERDIEPIRIPRDRLDVLSQQTISIVAAEDMAVGDLHRLIARSDSYRSFPIGKLRGMLQVLAGFYPFMRPLLDWNRDTDTLVKRRNTMIGALTGAGTIPSSSAYPVHHVDSRVHLGELDEEFVQESRVGDVFQLGMNGWMIRRIDKDRVYVSEAGNRFSEIPFWRAEGLGRTYSLGIKVGAFIAEVEERLQSEDEEQLISWLTSHYQMDDYTALQLLSLIQSQRSFCELPTDKRIVIETYRDLMNQTHVIMHNPFGRRLNRTWLLAIERQFELLLPYRLYGNAKDNGIEFVLPEWDSSWLQTIWQVTPANVEALLTEAITGSPLLAIAFRHIAETSLLLSRSFGRTPLWQKRLRSEELLRSALPYAEHFPYLTQAMKACLHDYLSLDDLRSLLTAIRDGEIEVVVKETEYPSPMATQFLADYVNMRIYEGDGLDPAIQMQLMNVSKELAGRLFGEQAIRSRIPEQVLEAERQRLSEPESELREASDVVRLLKRRGDLAPDELIQVAGTQALLWAEQLLQTGDLAIFEPSEDTPVEECRWICRDESEIYEAFPHSDEAASFIIRRFADNRIAFTDLELCERYPKLSLVEAKRLVDKLREEGSLDQAPFAASPEERIWSSRRAAERIIRLSIGEARKQVQPASPIRWCAQIALRQHALQGAQLRGSDGLRLVIERLQGIFLPLSHWESVIFPSRIADYRKEELDLLCATGEVIWLGKKQPGEKEGKVAFFLAGSRSIYEPYLADSKEQSASHPELLELLKRSGASFLTRLARDRGKLPTEILSALLDLAWEGHASNDQFAPLRLLTLKKGKDWAKTGSGLGRWYWTGGLAEDWTEHDHADIFNQNPNADPPEMYWIRHLMETYGIVTKELTATVTPYSWDRLQLVLRKLEEWGTLTRGLFIEGAITLQFTTPDMADLIRKPLSAAGSESPEAITLLSAVDPANPFGLLMDWPEGHDCAFARKPGHFLVIRGDKWLYWIENNGKRIHTIEKQEAEQLPSADELKWIFMTLLRRQHLSKIVVERWNGETVSSSREGLMLKEIGAESDQKSLVLWQSQLK
ncbi:DEAD/DEAH box helicase [Paenibacillus glycanilyticus]|uniref:DEAD/DEAH box helicase n=1 Tax=Paenibacillus glycanilyticus TaxID=126569 RepID=UPI0020404B72|nr:DEAD/DEAH box helicase [Paenibacillus glycanilyticus]MCM3628660.1 DEAD/DEAH box helicase [Paenibacillus glycanilyticus]